MTSKNAIGAIAMAALLVLAGCSSAVPGATTHAQTTTDGSVDDGQSMDSTDAADLTFYVSDRPGAIDDFEHLNVTITKIGLHKTDGGDDDANETETDGEASETDSANDTTDASMDAADVDTTTVDDPNETTVEMTTTEDTETEEDDSEETETETEEDDSEDTESEETDSEESESGESKAEWVTKDVDNRTVDLTKLKGANATAIGNLSVPAGEYDKVFVYVSDINATLTNGESVNVKLPSSKLQIKKDFTLSANSSPDFVFDINVHKAGGSGKYILRPIVSESGTGDQVEIREVDENGKPTDAGANGKDEGKQGGDDDGEETDGDDANETESEDGESDASALEASLDGQLRAGETVTLSVTDANGSVANATVAVNGETVGETAANGTLAFEVPDTEELEVSVTKGDAEVELERDVKGGNGNGNGQQLSGYALAAA